MNRTTIRRVLMAVACAVTLSAQAADDTAKKIDVPAGQLIPALKALGAQTGVEFVYSIDQLEGLSTKGVHGKLTPEKAVAKLLEGTRLRVTMHESGAVLIATPEANSAANQNELGPVVPIAPTALRVAQNEQNQTSTQNTENKSTSESPSGDSEDNKLAEIVVTAQRREENLQNVPIAVTAISQEVLDENHVNSVADLSYLVPGLAPPQGFAREIQWLTIRGQGANTSGIPGVIQYFNEVPLPSTSAGTSPSGAGLYYDMENIQVLKGPQGTLFGRNAVGGAVLYQTKRPSQDLEGYLELGGGNYNEREFTGVLNLPLVADKLAIRFAANGQQRDGSTKLFIYPTMRRGRNLDNQDYIAGRMSVAFHPTENFRNDLIVDYLDSDSDGTQRILTTNDALGSGFPTSAFPIQAEIFAQQQRVGPRAQVSLFDGQHTQARSTTVSNISQYDISDRLKLRNIVGYVDTKLDYTSEFGPWLYFDPLTTHLQQYTEELQLQGQSLKDKLQWIFGGFYSDLPKPSEFERGTACVFGPCVDGNGDLSTTLAKSNAQSKALYAQGTYDLSSWVSGLRFTAGLRYTWDDRGGASFILSSTGACLTPPAEGSGLACGAEGTTSSSAPTWTLNLEYQATSDVLAYLASRRGYRTGGFNAGQANLPPFDPEYVTDVELGLKADWHLAGMPGRTNVAIYNQKYTDVQVEELLFNPNDPANPLDVTGNAAAARVRGGEFEGVIRPTPELQLGAIFSYLRWEFTDIGATVVNPESLTRIPNYGLPRTQFGLNARYTLPIEAQMGRLSLAANYSWVERMINGRPPTPGGDLPAYGYLNFNADWEHIASSPLSLSLFVTNVTNELHNGNLSNGPGGSVYPLGLNFSVGQYDPPRMYGVKLRYDFGASDR